MHGLTQLNYILIELCKFIASCRKVETLKPDVVQHHHHGHHSPLCRNYMGSGILHRWAWSDVPVALLMSAPAFSRSNDLFGVSLFYQHQWPKTWSPTEGCLGFLSVKWSCISVPFLKIADRWSCWWVISWIFECLALPSRAYLYYLKIGTMLYVVLIVSVVPCSLTSIPVSWAVFIPLVCSQHFGKCSSRAAGTLLQTVKYNLSVGKLLSRTSNDIHILWPFLGNH